jgi:hypothetical protein
VLFGGVGGAGGGASGAVVVGHWAEGGGYVGAAAKKAAEIKPKRRCVIGLMCVYAGLAALGFLIDGQVYGLHR